MRKLSSVQVLSRVQLSVTPWTTACQASLSITNSQSLLRLMSIKLVMPSNHLILCHPLLLLPSIFPSYWKTNILSILCNTPVAINRLTDILFSFLDKRMGLGTSSTDRVTSSQTWLSDWTELTELNTERARVGALLRPSWAPRWQPALITNCVMSHFGCPASRDLDDCSPSGPLPLTTYETGKGEPPSGSQ